MRYWHPTTGTIFYTFDQERLWLAKNADAACIEGSEFHLAKRAEYGIVEYVEPAPAPKTLAEVKAEGIAAVKQIRMSTLRLYPKDVGVSVIYANNIDAAYRHLLADTTPMPTGQTPEQYLAGLGAELGMTAGQFADYIIGENIRLGAPDQALPSAYDVEKHYLRASVAVQTALTAEAVQTIIDNYATYCQPVTGQ